MDPVSVYFFIENISQIVKNWWWVPVPFILWKPFTLLLLHWRIDLFINQQTSIVLEIRLPKETFKPVRAMEVVMSSIHQSMYQPAGSLWEKWIDGQVQLSVCIELVSIDGNPHFFIRIPVQYRESVEASIYAHFPEIEILEVDDYTKYVPQSIPNKDWDLFGSDYKLLKPDYYPIKTYPEFEKESALEAVEEKKVDPVAGLLESMSKIKKGEQLWIQFLLDPIADADLPKSYTLWAKQGEALRDKLARRTSDPKKSKPVIQEAIEIILTGKQDEKKEDSKEIIPPEMKLTPGEREVLAAIEKKMSKPIFQTTARFIYLGKRDIFFKQNFRLAFSYFSQYTTNNLNSLQPNGKTLTKIHKSVAFPPLNFIRKRRLYLRGRRLFRHYVKRLSPFFPRPGGTFMLNTEEMASLFHFPSEKTAPSPSFSRIEAKRKGSSSSLPTE